MMDFDVVGCLLVLGGGDTWILTFIGLNYNVRYAYLQLVYAGIRCATEGGAQTLRGGAGAYETKRKHGSHLKGNHHVMFADGAAVFEKLGRWVAGREERRIADPYDD